MFRESLVKTYNVLFILQWRKIVVKNIFYLAETDFIMMSKYSVFNASYI